MKPDYGNWIARPMMRTLWGITAALVLATLLCALLIGRDTAYGVLLVLSLMSLLAALYMTYCRHILSEDGGGLMRRIHSALIDRFPWDGRGTVLDIGCGTGALSIALAQQYPEAHVVGVDLWPPMWDSSAEQCVRNATDAPSCRVMRQHSMRPTKPSTPSSATSSFTKCAPKRINSCLSSRRCAS